MDKRKVSWSGVVTPVVTPFTEDGAVDRDAFASLLNLLIEEGVNGVIVAGTTGEFYSLNENEKVDLFSFAVDAVGGRVPVLAGTSCIGTRDTVQLTEKAQKAGVDGALLLPPAFCMPTPREIIGYFRAIAEVGLPIMAYNNPARTGVFISPAVASEIKDIPNVVAFKETQKDIYVFSETFRVIEGSLDIFVGLEPYATAMFSRGATGIVSTISNVCAKDVVELQRFLDNGDNQGARAAQERIDKLYLLMARSGLSNFAYVKAAMQVLGRPGGLPRAPHLPADQATLKAIEQGLREIHPEFFE